MVAMDNLNYIDYSLQPLLRLAIRYMSKLDGYQIYLNIVIFL